MLGKFKHIRYLVMSNCTRDRAISYNNTLLAGVQLELTYVIIIIIIIIYMKKLRSCD